MNNDPPEFDSPGQLEYVQAMSAELGPVGDTLSLSGVRQSPLTIKIMRSTQYDPKRDALTLHAHLSTSLEIGTWAELVRIIITENQPLIMEQVMDYLEKQRIQPFPSTPSAPVVKKSPSTKPKPPKQQDFDSPNEDGEE